MAKKAETKQAKPAAKTDAAAKATAAPAAKKTGPHLTKKEKLSKHLKAKASRRHKAAGAAKTASAAKQKAQAVQKVAKVGQTKHVKKIHTAVSFHRPKTLRLAKAPKYPRVSVLRSSKMDQFRVLKHPLTTESSLKKIEDNNTLVFIVDPFANKHQIALAVEKLYAVKPDRINTLVRPDGKKKAFVRLPKDVDALAVS